MAQTSLYTKLQKLFSSNVIIRRVGRNMAKVIDTDSIQSYYTSNMRERYQRLFSRSNQYQTSATRGILTGIQSQRLAMFRDYEIMDQDPIIASALDIYSEEACLKNESGQVLSVSSDSTEIKEILENLFYDILNVEFTLPAWIRSVCKYGDFFIFLEIMEGIGVINVLPLSVYDTERIEGENEDNPHEIKFITLGQSGKSQKLDNFEVVHFRLLSDANFYPYGRSAIEPARRIFRQIYLMEDAMLIHRIMRAPQKRVISVDIGNIPANEISTYMQKVMDETKKAPILDPATGQYNMRYNMQNLIEDYYFPVRGKDNGTKIDTLSGLEYNAIEDINYLLKKLFAALKIPKAFLGYEEELSGKLTLAAEDVRFSRTVEKIQRIVVSELTKIAVVHLYAQGYRNEDLTNFTLSLTHPSTIYEQEKINLWQEKLDFATNAKASKMLSEAYIYENIFKISEEDYIRERELIADDAKRTFRYSQIEQGMGDPAKMDPMQTMQQNGGGDDGMGLPGAPEKGTVYGQDSHPRGRDPLGGNERYQITDPDVQGESFNKLTKKQDIGTYMDESILLNENEMPFNLF